MKSLEKPIYALLQKEPFYANFLLGAKIIFDLPGVNTACARVINDHIEFIFNTDWLLAKTIPQQTDIIKHEILHVLLDHTGVRGGPKTDRLAKNIAMDCAINQYLGDLPESVVTLKSVEEFCKRSLLPMESWEYYYAAINDQRDKNGGNGCEEYENDHHVMEQGDGECQDESTKDSKEAFKKAIVKNAINKAINASAGNVPQNLQNLISKMTAEAELPWKQILRNFVANTRSTINKTTRLKMHRRFDLDQPGKKKLKKLKLGVCVDESGSVSNEAWTKFMSEIKAIAKNTTVTYIVHADCKVHKIDTIKNGKASAEVLGTRHSSGGTAYQPAIDACINKQCDAIIYFGDFDCADKPTNPGLPFLWVGVGSSPAPAEFGKVLRLND